MIHLFKIFGNKRQNHIVKNIDLLEHSFFEDYFKFYPTLINNKDILYFEKSNCYAAFKYDVVKSILQNKTAFSNAYFYEVDKILLGADGSEHIASKRLVLEKFSFLNGFIDPEKSSFIEQLIEQLISNIYTQKKQKINIVDWIVNPFVLNTLMYDYGLLKQHPAFDILSNENNHSEQIQSISRLFDHSNMIDELIKEIIKKKQGSEKFNSLLSDLQQSYNDNDIFKFTKTFTQAGILTTSSLITSCIFFMDQLDSEQINEDIYLEAFIDEVLRIHSPSQFVFRRANEDIYIDKVLIPKNSDIAISIGAANRDEKKFDHPSDFILNRNEKHIAFGGGSHKCIGTKITMSTAKSFIRKFYPYYQKLSLDSSITNNNTQLIFKISELYVNL